MIDKVTIIESFNSICRYIDFQMELIKYGVGIEDSNAGNQLLLSFIKLIKTSYGNNETINRLIDEFCWEGMAGLYPIDVVIGDKSYWIGSIHDLLKAIDEILSDENKLN